MSALTAHHPTQEDVSEERLANLNAEATFSFFRFPYSISLGSAKLNVSSPAEAGVGDKVR